MKKHPHKKKEIECWSCSKHNSAGCGTICPECFEEFVENWKYYSWITINPQSK